MKVGTLLDIVRRSDLDDAAQPYLWSDDDLIEYADDAQNEACRRGRLLVDSTTADTCQIAVLAGTHTYALDARVIRVNRARLSGESRPLGFRQMRKLDDLSPGWEDWSGTPEVILPDWQEGSIRLVPSPDSAGTLNLTVVRLPLATINDPDDAFEVRDEHLRNLRHWIVYRAFLKRDSETYDPERAAQALALFEREFGPPQPAYAELWAQQYHSEDTGNGRF
ncbi:MAG: DUF6682 family protein [Candidatus Paceibacterota bacterium]|jgi:hypothetical protein